MDDLKKLEILLAKLEAHEGSLVISNNNHIWTVAVVTQTEDMCISGFDAGSDLGELLTNVIEELEYW